MALVKDIQDRVREVAYLMWESAGRHHGMAMEYWLQAEREVITTMQSAAERMMPGQAPGATPAEAAPVSQTSAPVVEASQEAAKALSAPSAPEAAAAPATAEAEAEAEPVSQASDAVVEATPAVAEASAAAGSTAAAAKAAAKPTRKAGTRAKRIPPPAS